MTGRHHAPDTDLDTVSFAQIAADARDAHLSPQREPVAYADGYDDQVIITAQYLASHHSHPSAVHRAAVMLRAHPTDLACTRYAGISIDITKEGKPVRCTACGNRYDCLPENPAFTDPADPKAVWCLTCLLIETRDPAAVAPVEPSAIHAPRKRRKPVAPVTEEPDES